MDLTLPNLAREEKYLLLPSDLAGLASVLVELLRLSEGIMELFDDLTLAVRASDAFVGVVMALGRLVIAALTAEVAGVFEIVFSR